MIGQENTEPGKAVVDRFHELAQRRNRRTDEMRKVSRVYRPSRQGFGSHSADNDNFNLHDLFNSRTLQVASDATASLYSTLCNPANQWLQSTTFDPELAEFRDVKVWLDTVTARLLASCAPALSNFYSSAVPLTADSSILGTGAMVTDEGSGRRRLQDSCVSPVHFVFATDAFGLANELIVERWLTARQIARQYGYDNLSDKLKDKALDGNATDKFRVLQAYQLNDRYIPGRVGKQGFEYMVTHVVEDMKLVLRQSGTYEQAFGIPRWFIDGDDEWGRGLGYMNLASAVKLQLQERDNLQAGALAARPPVGTPGIKGMKKDAKLAPGAYLHGAMSYQGQQLVKPIFTFNGLPVTNDMAQRTIEEIEKGWHAVLLSLVGRTGLGNLEVIERTEERLRLQAPYVANLQSEWLGPILQRRFALLWRAGQIPAPPDEMKGQPLDIRFVSVAAQAQKAAEGVAITRVLQDTTELAKAHPNPDEVWDGIDTDYAQAALVDARGAPKRLSRSPEDIEARRAARAEQAQAAQALEAGQAGASIASDLAGVMPDGMLQ